MNRTIKLAAALLAAAALAACAPGGASSGDGDAEETINIVGFAVPEAANKDIAAEFNKTPEGEGVEFETSYGASGDQSRAVVAGLEADYVHFSVRATSPAWSTRASSPTTGTTARTRASCPTRSSSSPSARATPRTSRTGTT